MKKTILTICGLITLNLLFGQANCDDLIVENKSLKAQLGYKPNENVTIKGISESIDIQIIDCIGSSDQQTVTINFVISHSMVHQEMCINIDNDDAKAYDIQGNEFLAKFGNIGNTSSTFNCACNKVPTDVPVKGSIVFRNVLPSCEFLKFVTIKFGYKNEDGGSSWTKSNLELRNLKIEW